MPCQGGPYWGIKLKPDCSRSERTPQGDDEAIAAFKRFNDARLGGFGENVWNRVMHDSGWHYIPLAKIQNGGAPMAQSNGDSVVLPDMDVSHEGRTAYVEVKAKTTSVYFRKTSQERHGIDYRNFTQYVRVSEMFNKKCAIALVELWRESKPYTSVWSGSLLIETLKNLGPPTNELVNGRMMSLWRRKDFNDIASFTPSELFALEAGKQRTNCKIELDSILFPFTQRGMFDE